MDPRLLRYYNSELAYLREMGGEFARAFPKIAGRLSLDEFECADPYVERLLEGFSFLAARVQLKIDEEFPRFTQHLLERVYPDYLSPAPSMTLVRFQPDLQDPSLADGFVLPRHSVLRSRLGKESQTACEYRTAHPITLWPIELTAVDYLPSPAAIVAAGGGRPEGVKAGMRFRLRTTGGIPFNMLALDTLCLHLTGGETAMQAYEALIGHALQIIGGSPAEEHRHQATVDRQMVTRVGFSAEESLLPCGPRSFQGYRLLDEYFSLPERFMFVALNGLRELIRRCDGNELEIIVLLDQPGPVLEENLGDRDFLLFCTPAINLFPKRADRVHLTDKVSEYHILPDRTRPLDFEVYQVTEVNGFGSNAKRSQRFLPFYSSNDFTAADQPRAYFALHRLPRTLSSRQQREGARSSYVGSELFISLVDADEAPYDSDLRQLGISTLCTNRDLPLHMPLNQGDTDFNLDASAPLTGIRCIGSPTRPRPSLAQMGTAWRLINHLSLNYLSLADEDRDKSTAALKDLLQLYADTRDITLRKQVEGVVSITSRPVNRRIPGPGPITFGRGLEITLTLDEMAFEGSGAFLFGGVMEQFFRKYTSINSFTETVINTLERGEIMRWPVTIGLRQTL